MSNAEGKGSAPLHWSWFVAVLYIMTKDREFAERVGRVPAHSRTALNAAILVGERDLTHPRPMPPPEPVEAWEDIVDADRELPSPQERPMGVDEAWTEMRRYIVESRLCTRDHIAADDLPADFPDGFERDIYVSLADVLKFWPAEAAPRNKRGRKPKYQWDVVQAEAMRLMDEHGDFSSDDQWNGPEALIAALQVWHMDKHGTEPSRTRLQELLPAWVAEWREEKGRR